MRDLDDIVAAAAEALRWVARTDELHVAVVAARPSGSFVLVLVHPPSARRAIVKTATLPADELYLEAQAMARAAAASPTGAVPEVIALLDVEGRRLLVQQAMAGTSMLSLLRTRRIRGRATRAVVARAAGWLRNFRAATQTPDYAAAADPSGGQQWWAGLGGSPRMADDLGRLAGLRTRGWMAHGDFWPGNLIVDRHRLGIVDWQHSYAGDRVLADVWWLLFSSVHATPNRRGGWRSAAAAFRQTFLEPGAVADAWEPVVRTHLRDVGIPGSLAPAALVEALHRYGSLAAVREPLGPTSSDWAELASMVEAAAPGSLLGRLRPAAASS